MPPPLGFDALLIVVSVEGETATLTGEVAKAPTLRLAERIALSVKGIRKIDNKVTVGPAGEHCFGTANSISTSR
jgi:osmotically-inducible protein OsmY